MQQMDHEPISISPLAQAMAERNTDDNYPFAEAFAEAFGESSTSTNKQKEAARLAETYQRILDSSGNPLIGKAIILASSYKSVQEGLEKQFAQIDMPSEHVHQVSLDGAEYGISIFGGDDVDEYVPRLIREVQAANEISQERGVDVIEIFRTDSLYSELIRRTYTTSEYAQVLLKLISKYNSENMRKFLLSTLITPLTGQAPDSDFFDEILEQASHDPEMQKVIDEPMRKVQKSFTLIAADQLRKHWGVDAVETLPPFLKDQFKRADS
ncbi:MAG: hypothetical protein Q7R49_02270 [Candidatus Daviesbacteria bacterium]|nr:hypothetical protein [Candidatus Daviesbacteria bacterium]